MNNSIFVRFLAIAAIAFTLSACKSSEERAEEHYQNGISLIEQGDKARGLVELRNVFKLNGQHRDARATYAKVMLETGRTSDAYGQYLRLVEQYPNDLEARIALSTIAFVNRNLEEFDRHSAAALELAPDAPETRSIRVASEYRKALNDEDVPAQEAVVAKAEAAAKDSPDDLLLRRVIIEGYLRANRFTEVLDALSVAIEKEPESRIFYDMKLNVYRQLRDADGIENLLAQMVTQFPDDAVIKSNLIQVYLSRGKKDEAEAFLRSIADPAAEDPGYYLSLIQFLMVQRSPDAALAELDKSIATVANPVLLKSIRAGIDFDRGRRDEAVAQMEELLANAAEGQDTSRVKIALARMFIAMSNDVGARRLVEEVLVTDKSNNDALKMQAAWQVEADQTDAAIAGLRTVLDQSPQDAQAMTLMASAYSRAGNHDLARDFLSLAVEASDKGVDESIRYARRLQVEERFIPAEDALIASLRAHPNNLALLEEMGRLYLAMKDVPRTAQVVTTIRGLTGPEAIAIANDIELKMVAQRDGSQGAMSFLEDLAKSDNDAAAKIGIVRAYVAAGESEKARDYAKTLMDEDPENLTLKFMYAMTEATVGNLALAVEKYRELLAIDPKFSRVWLELSRAQSFMGDQEASLTSIDQGLENAPNDALLLWAKAGFVEKSGDIPGAIAIYEDLYEADSNSLIVANNLATLLVVQSTDAATIERAYNVARRLRGTTVPPLQDTYGWIAHLRGESEEALPYLEGAARGLTNDPAVQAHLGMVYAALGRTDDAIAQLTIAVDLAKDTDTRPEIQDARETLEKLKAAPKQ